MTHRSSNVSRLAYIFLTGSLMALSACSAPDSAGPDIVVSSNCDKAAKTMPVCVSVRFADPALTVGQDTSVTLEAFNRSDRDLPRLEVNAWNGGTLDLASGRNGSTVVTGKLGQSGKGETNTVVFSGIKAGESRSVDMPMRAIGTGSALLVLSYPVTFAEGSIYEESLTANSVKIAPGEVKADDDTERFLKVRGECTAKVGNDKAALRACMKGKL